jgi:HNH endonuclease
MGRPDVTRFIGEIDCEYTDRHGIRCVDSAYYQQRERYLCRDHSDKGKRRKLRSVISTICDNDGKCSVSELHSNDETEKKVAQVEVWRSLRPLGFAGYQISTMGHVRNMKLGGTPVNGGLSQGGYARVILPRRKGKSRGGRLIQKLVIQSFVRFDLKGWRITHLNGNLGDNSLANLRLVTYSQLSSTMKRSSVKHGRSVYQCDAGTGEKIKKWNTLKEAALFHRVSGATITLSAKKMGYLCAGFQWYYCDLVDLIDGEEWRIAPFPEYQKLYASNMGRIKKRERGAPTFGNDNYGYRRIHVRTVDGKKATVAVHEITLASFIGRNDEMDVNHKDGNKGNNRLENLEYLSRSANMQHAYDTGLIRVKSDAHRVPVVQYDDEMNVVARFASAIEASKKTGINKKSIVKVCKGRFIHAGWYRWAYQENTLGTH